MNTWVLVYLGLGALLIVPAFVLPTVETELTEEQKQVVAPYQALIGVLMWPLLIIALIHMFVATRKKP